MQVLKHIRLSTKRSIAAIAIVAALAAGIGWWRSDASATPPAPAPTPTPTPAPAPAADTQPALPPSDDASAAAVVTTPVAQVDPTKAQIVFATYPPSNATVTWGKTRLGRITPHQPLVVVRPRDSGPLDVVVSAPGYLRVQTRAQTFADCKVLVRLTRVANKATLLGYRAPIDAGPPLMGDGGVPETLSDMPFSLTSPLLPPTTTPAVPQPQPQPKPPAQPQPQPKPQAQPQPQPAPRPVGP